MVAMIFAGSELDPATLVPIAFAVVLCQSVFEVVRAGPMAVSPEASDHH